MADRIPDDYDYIRSRMKDLGLHGGDPFSVAATAAAAPKPAAPLSTQKYDDADNGWCWYCKENKCPCDGACDG